MIGGLTHLIRGAAIRAILGGQEAINPARLALFSDWAETLPPRPLPRTVTPVPGEYYLDYIFRLADANHLEFLELTEALDDPAAVILDPGRQKQHQQERLAAAASQPLGRIARLHWDDPGDYLRDPEGFRQLLRPACRRCTARRGIVGPVACRLPPHLTVCRRHRLWIGPSARTPRRPLDVSPLPEILHAQRRHLAQLTATSGRKSTPPSATPRAPSTAPSAPAPGPRASGSACASSTPAPGHRPRPGPVPAGKTTSPANSSSRSRSTRTPSGSPRTTSRCTTPATARHPEASRPAVRASNTARP